MVRGSQLASGIWLFVRGTESVRILRPESHYGLRVHGPGPRWQEYDFTGEEERAAFQNALEAQLAAAGWVLESFSERRATPERRQAPRRSASERRTIGR